MEGSRGFSFFTRNEEGMENSSERRDPACYCEARGEFL